MIRRPRSAVLWALVLVAAPAALVLGRPAPARAAAPAASGCVFFCPTTTAPTTAPTTTPTTAAPTTTAPPTTAPPPTTASAPTTTAPAATTAAPPTTTEAATGRRGGAAVVPCRPQPSGACSEDPTQVALYYPSGSRPAGAEVSFVTVGRPAAAPRPAALNVLLDAATARPCPETPAGQQAMCWAWPAALRDASSVLNGTYRVTPCSATTGGRCQASGTVAAATWALAVAPRAPQRATAAVTGPAVRITWTPATDPEPDLAGYAVSRDGQVVYDCSIAGLGPGAGTPCPADRTVHDSPGDGEWSYAVTALRLGADPAPADVLASLPTAVDGTSVTVAGPPGAASGSGPLQPQPGFASLPAPAATGGSGGAQPDPATARTAAAGPVGALPYAGSGGAGGRTPDLKLRIGAAGGRADVAPAATVALAAIVMALAAHFLFLRSQLGLLEARRGRAAASRRRAASG